jgi:formate dehydrogenase maturation protein FdhE
MNGVSHSISLPPRWEAFGKEFSGLLSQYESENPFRRPPLKITREESAQRMAEGRFLLRPCGVEFRHEFTGHYAVDLFAFLNKHLGGAAPDIAKIEQKFLSGELDRHKILEYIFSNQANDLLEIIKTHHFLREAMSLFCVYYARPFRAAAARLLTKEIDLSHWKSGYCPICGHWPSVSQLTNEPNRNLWCLHCGTVWPYPKDHCPFCRDEKHGLTETIASSDNIPCRARACLKCERYIKEVISDLPASEIPFDGIYIASSALDHAALQAGYIRECLLSVRYEFRTGNELLMYRQEASTCSGRSKQN